MIIVQNIKQKNYNKEIITLQYDKSCYDDEKELRKLWGFRVNKYFPEYRVTKVSIQKNKGSLVVK